MALEDLSFDEDTHKPYHVDAEALFAPYNRPFYNAYTCSYQLSLADIERAASAFLARREARNKHRLDRLQKAKVDQDEARELLASSDMQISLFQNKGKWGHRVGDLVVEPTTYSKAELYEDEELILLYKGRRYQFVDYIRCGDRPCLASAFPDPQEQVLHSYRQRVSSSRPEHRREYSGRVQEHRSSQGYRQYLYLMGERLRVKGMV